MYACELCNRLVECVTDHHLIPRCVRTKKRIKRDFTKAQRNQTVIMCTDCHPEIHKLFDNKKLALTYNTIASLKQHYKVKKWLDYISKK